MSLRIRLVVLIVALVSLVAIALAGLYLQTLLNTLSAGAIQFSQFASQQIGAFLIGRINQHSGDYEAPRTSEEALTLAYKIVKDDPDVTTMLINTMAQSDFIVEINVAEASGQILSSSNPARLGSMLTPLQDFPSWMKTPLIRRLRDLIRRRPNYEVILPLGFQGGQTLFSVQVVTSGVFLRDDLLLLLRPLAEVSAVAFLTTLLITVLATNRILRPVKRIEQTIDRIAQGQYGDQQTGKNSAKEFAVVESKLNLLGQQFRGARENATELRHDIEQLLERMASQLDVATRLAAISKLTGSVAHEIKNPLNAISLHLDLLRAKLGGAEPELTQEIDILSKEVLRLDRVVKTFLDFSKPLEVHFEEVDLSEVAREIVELMTPSARLARITLELDTPPEPVCARADPDMIRQAVLNLVNNAMEAMKTGGLIRVTAGRSEGAVTLEVADSGPGIPVDLRDKVFQLYFTTKTRGSGIGLALTYRAVQLHNGTIVFTSEEGRGTTFRLQFPAMVRHV